MPSRALEFVREPPAIKRADRARPGAHESLYESQGASPTTSWPQLSTLTKATSNRCARQTSLASDTPPRSANLACASTSMSATSSPTVAPADTDSTVDLWVKLNDERTEIEYASEDLWTSFGRLCPSMDERCRRPVQLPVLPQELERLGILRMAHHQLGRSKRRLHIERRNQLGVSDYEMRRRLA